MRGYTAADAYKMAVVWGLAAALLAVIVTRGALPVALVVIVAVCCFAAVIVAAYRMSSLAAPTETAAPTSATPASAASQPAASAPTPQAAPLASHPVAPVSEETPASEETPLSAAAPASDGGPVSDGAPTDAAPAFMAAPPEDGGDDLKRIKGVGPKLAAQLNRMGVYRFAQIAAWTPAEVAWVDDNLEGFKGRVTRDGWVDQAQVLAHGGTTEFAARVDAGDVPSSQG